MPVRLTRASIQVARQGPKNVRLTRISVQVARSVGINLEGAQSLEGDALFGWMIANDTVTSGELVGALNELNGTTGVEYWQARKTYLGL